MDMGRNAVNVIVWLLLIKQVGTSLIPFRTMGGTPGVITIPLLASEDAISRPTMIQFGLPFLHTRHTTVYVSENGLISFSQPFSQPPSSAAKGFEVSNTTYLIAPFWSDNDIRNAGQVRYEVYMSGTGDQDEVLEEISLFVSNKTREEVDFHGRWMLLVEWTECHPYPHGSNPASMDPYLQLSNTYQAIVITDGIMRSYAIFIYECDRIQWGGRGSVFARVGVSGGGRETLHLLSGNDSVSSIDCLNDPTSRWVNVVYDLVNDGAEPSVNETIQPSATLISTAFITSTTATSPDYSIDQTSIQSAIIISPSFSDAFNTRSSVLSLQHFTASRSNVHTSVGSHSATKSNRLSSEFSHIRSSHYHTSSVLVFTSTVSPAGPTPTGDSIGDLNVGGTPVVIIAVVIPILVVVMGVVMVTTILTISILYHQRHNRVQSLSVKKQVETQESSVLVKSHDSHVIMFTTASHSNKTSHHGGLLVLEDSYRF